MKQFTGTINPALSHSPETAPAVGSVETPASAMSTFHCPTTIAESSERDDPATFAYSLQYSEPELHLYGHAPASGYGLASEAILCSTVLAVVLAVRLPRHRPTPTTQPVPR